MKSFIIYFKSNKLLVFKDNHIIFKIVQMISKFSNTFPNVIENLDYNLLEQSVQIINDYLNSTILCLKKAERMNSFVENEKILNSLLELIYSLSKIMISCICLVKSILIVELISISLLYSEKDQTSNSLNKFIRKVRAYYVVFNCSKFLCVIDYEN